MDADRYLFRLLRLFSSQHLLSCLFPKQLNICFLKGWSSLISNAFFILPTWKLFRNSPQNTRHTLPQGFFIQVFLATQSLILQAISQLTGIWVPFFVMVLYIISTYKQLFGYRWWGTIWRTITNIIIGFSMVFLLSLFTYMITKIVT